MDAILFFWWFHQNLDIMDAISLHSFLGSLKTLMIAFIKNSFPSHYKISVFLVMQMVPYPLESQKFYILIFLWQKVNPGKYLDNGR